jgi:hypothetical protein
MLCCLYSQRSADCSAFKALCALLLLLLQVDHLSRQLSRGAADGEEVAAQREGLLGELAAAQQVRQGGRSRTRQSSSCKLQTSVAAIQVLHHGSSTRHICPLQVPCQLLSSSSSYLSKSMPCVLCCWCSICCIRCHAADSGYHVAAVVRCG